MHPSKTAPLTNKGKLYPFIPPISVQDREFVAIHVLQSLVATDKELREAFTKIHSSPRIASVGDAFKHLQIYENKN